MARLDVHVGEGIVPEHCDKSNMFRGSEVKVETWKW